MIMIKSVKLSNAQVLALQNITHHTNGRAYVTEGKTQTLNALRRMGILFGDGNTLTRQGLSAALACEKPSMRGGQWYAVVTLADEGESRDEYNATPVVATVTVQDMPSVPDMANVPSECFFGCTRRVFAAFCDTYGKTEGVCEIHADRLSMEFWPLPVIEPEVIMVDVTEVIPGDVIVGAEDMGAVRTSRPHVDGPSVHMIYGDKLTDAFGAPQRIGVIRNMPQVHESKGEPYVMEGRVMITGLDLHPVHEGTARFIITPGYTTQADCARMECMKRYGRVNNDLRVTELRYVGPLN
jgi:hypothetical protein